MFVADPWAFSQEVVTLGQPGGIVTLVEGSTFCISGRSGDIRPGSPQGLFFQDSRFLSHFELRVNGRTLEPLSVAVDDPFIATYVTRARPSTGRADSTVLVFRHRYLGGGLREDIVVRNFGEEATSCVLEVILDADFADVFEVKEGRVVTRGEHRRVLEGPHLHLRHTDGPLERGLAVSFDRPVAPGRDVARFDMVVEAQGEWRLCLEIAPVVGDEQHEPRYQCGQPVERSQPSERLGQWRSRVPLITTDFEPLATAVRKGQEDLGALRIFDPETPDRAVIAAGAPWFMALFGRDSLLTSWSALMVDPELALGVLETLARFQGDDVVPQTEEEPGRILHEMRFGSASNLLGGTNTYYGSADATPLFVMLLGELRRWNLAPGLVERMLPHADRALHWIENFGDRDGDGYVEYQRATDHGLPNQGWKDSSDGIRYADGTVARAPIALAEVQGYVFAAYKARVHFANEAGDDATANHYRVKAADLKARFNEDFWCPEQGWFAIALDGHKRRVDALASNMGHCLWTGIIDEDKAERVARHLVSPSMFSGWGIRTMATSMVGYNPISYHCGSVWPHDTAIAAAGLMRYGYVEEAQRVLIALLEASMSDAGRLPEVFSGLDRHELSIPVAFPTSCSPQAWAAASPALALRTLLRFEPMAPSGRLNLAPALPPEIRRLRVARIPLDGRRISIEVDGDDVQVEGLGPGIEVVSEPRAPLSPNL